MKKKLLFKNCDGVEYEVIFKKPHHSYKAIGTCDNPHEDNPKIHIDPELKEFAIIDLVCHECAHSFFWDLPEYKVDKFARTVAQIIKASGLVEIKRKTEIKKKPKKDNNPSS
jgi:hypothetical protein